MSNYNERFKVLKKYLYEAVPKPSRIYNIMSGLELSQRLAMELCFNLTRSTFRHYLKKELENDDFNDTYITLMPDNTWRYFKLNCCVYADRYDRPSPYTRYNANKKFKPLAHIHLDLVRYLNNWHSLANFIEFKQDKKTFIKNEGSTSYSGILVDKGDINATTSGEQDVAYLLGRADEVANMLGFKDAEALMTRMILHPEQNKIALTA